MLLHLTWHAPSAKAALLRGWVFGVGHFTLGNNWIQHAFDFQDKMPPVLGYFAVVLLALYLAVYPAVAMGLAWRFARIVKARWNGPISLSSSPPPRPGSSPNMLRGTLFTGYPWNPMAAIMGADADRAARGLLRHLCAVGAHPDRRRRAATSPSQHQYRVPLATAALLLVAGFALNPGRPVEDLTRPHVRVVQPNIGQEGVDRPDYAPRVLAKLAEWSGQPGGVPRLVVWPEGMVNYYVEDGYPPPSTSRAIPAGCAGRIARTARAAGSRDDRRQRAVLRRGPANRARANSVWTMDPGRACSAGATTRRISSPMASICRCARCWRRSASPGW